MQSAFVVLLEHQRHTNRCIRSYGPGRTMARILSRRERESERERMKLPYMHARKPARRDDTRDTRRGEGGWGICIVYAAVAQRMHAATFPQP